MLLAWNWRTLGSRDPAASYCKSTRQPLLIVFGVHASGSSIALLACLKGFGFKTGCASLPGPSLLTLTSSDSDSLGSDALAILSRSAPKEACLSGGSKYDVCAAHLASAFAASSLICSSLTMSCSCSSILGGDSRVCRNHCIHEGDNLTSECCIS